MPETRLIDANALLKKLQEQQKYSSVTDSRGRAKAIVELIHAPTVDAGEWIPCSERMPDEDSYKWAVGITSTGRCIAFQEHNAYENDTGGISVPTYLAHGSEITHWMPIPEPPGGEET